MPARGGRVLTDLAVLLADGGRCISDLAVLRDQSVFFGPVVSAATAWRVLDAVDAAALRRLRAARAAAREQLWAQRAETAGPIGGHRSGGRIWPGLRIVLDATLVTAHSEKESAAATFKRGFGYHPVRREALTIRAEVRGHRRRPCRSRAVKLRAA